MTFFEALLIAVALAMDCFTISFTCGILQRRMGNQVWAMAFLFGGFQALMTFLGWGATDVLSPQFHVYDQWVAFILLTALGGKMIWEGQHPHQQKCIDPSSWKVLFLLSIATSIDALAVGCSFVGMGIRSFAQMIWLTAIIGIISFIFTLSGKYIGIKVGRRFPWRGEQFGGAILIAIGLKVILQHFGI